MEFIAGDHGIVRLAHIADLLHDGADLVVILDGLLHGRLGGVDTQILQAVQNFLQLHFIVVEVGGVALDGSVDDVCDERMILNGMEQFEVLFHTLHGGAGLDAEQGVEVVVAAFNGTLQNGTDIGAVTVGHVVGSYVGRRAVGCTQTTGEATGQVQQNFGNIVAVVTKCSISVCYGLLHELVVGFLQKIFEIDQMLEILHSFFPL